MTGAVYEENFANNCRTYIDSYGNNNKYGLLQHVLQHLKAIVTRAKAHTNLIRMRMQKSILAVGREVCAKTNKHTHILTYIVYIYTYICSCAT